MNIIPNCFREKPALELMFGARIGAADRWRCLRFTEVETRQLAAVRKDIDDAYAVSLKPKAAAAMTLRFRSTELRTQRISDQGQPPADSWLREFFGLLRRNAQRRPYRCAPL